MSELMASQALCRAADIRNGKERENRVAEGPAWKARASVEQRGTGSIGNPIKKLNAPEVRPVCLLASLLVSCCRFPAGSEQVWGQFPSS